MVSKFYLFAGVTVFLSSALLCVICDAVGVPSFVPELVIVVAIVGCIMRPFMVQNRQDRSIAFVLFGFLAFLLCLFDLALHTNIVSASKAWMIIGCLGMLSMVIGGMKQEREAADY
ncbi:MAG TPA: hypothetical protein VGN56_02290 [Candidatus Paceibacterota bacterium]|jgi:NhaP-type Na+/H+ or K+/H+ antiporter|nr:hypothetical protein [Candidatus Paceibacterota bacterium]